jgi:hypothetical protein
VRFAVGSRIEPALATSATARANRAPSKPRSAATTSARRVAATTATSRFVSPARTKTHVRTSTSTRAPEAVEGMKSVHLAVNRSPASTRERLFEGRTPSCTRGEIGNRETVKRRVSGRADWVGSSGLGLGSTRPLRRRAPRSATRARADPQSRKAACTDPIGPLRRTGGQDVNASGSPALLDLRRGQRLPPYASGRVLRDHSDHDSLEVEPPEEADHEDTRLIAEFDAERQGGDRTLAPEVAVPIPAQRAANGLPQLAGATTCRSSMWSGTLATTTSGSNRSSRLMYRLV